jgi:outer membrane protein OmpA-like peptidoglycan-associated protein
VSSLAKNTPPHYEIQNLPKVASPIKSAAPKKRKSSSLPKSPNYTNSYELKLLRSRVDVLELSLNLWRSLVYGPPPTTSVNFASSSPIPLRDPLTDKLNFITSKAGTSLSAEGLALVNKIAEQLPKSDQKILVLGFAHDTADDLKMSSEYSLLVTRALLAAGIESERLRVSFFGATQGACNDKEKCAQSQVWVVVLAEGL